jgi:hypothetical protein
MLIVIIGGLISWSRYVKPTPLSLYVIGYALLGALFIDFALDVLPTYNTTVHSTITTWASRTAAVMALLAIAHTMRQLKPVYARYPVLFAYVPVAILGVFPVIEESFVLIRIVYIMVFGSALLVLFLMAVNQAMNKDQRVIGFFVAIVFVASSYVLEWFLTPVSSRHPWTVHVGMTLAIPSFIYVVHTLQPQFKKE